jgi:hypothetical protein
MIRSGRPHNGPAAAIHAQGDATKIAVLFVSATFAVPAGASHTLAHKIAFQQGVKLPAER